MKQKAIQLSILILGLLYIIFGFKEFFTHPNSGLLTQGGDGIKNYFTYLFYIQNDQGFHFTGMNYPFGEHITFTDNMPLLSMPLAFLRDHFPFLAQNALGILHLSLLLGLVLAIWYIYKILRHFKAEKTWALISALFITFFSPQIFRMFGHFGMGYIALIPMVLYQIIKYIEQPKWKFIIGLFFIACLSGFLHLYNLAIVIVLVGFFVLSFLISTKASFTKKLLTVAPLLSAVVLSFLVHNVVLKTTDQVTDRPTYPHAVLGYEAYPEDIFASTAPLGKVFDWMFKQNTGISNTEGKAYIGLVSILFLLFTLGKFVYSRYKKQEFIIAPEGLKSYNVWLWVALFHFLFAIGIPIVWIRAWLADYISIARQFRTIGRFIWPFYYIIMIYVALVIGQWISVWQKNGKRPWAMSLAISVTTIWLVQLYGYFTTVRSINIHKVDNYQRVFDKKTKNWLDFLVETGYKPADFQTAVGLPYFHIGSEKLWLQDVDEGRTAFHLFSLALQIGLNSTNVLMSRTSWGQTFEQVRRFSGPFSNHQTDSLFGEKPVLLLVNKNYPLSENETNWVKAAQFLGDKDEFLAVYRLDLKKLHELESMERNRFTASALNHPDNEGMLREKPGSFYYHHFDSTKNEIGIAGTAGIAKDAHKEGFEIDRIDLKPFIASLDSNLTVSIWAKLNKFDYRTTNYKLHFYDVHQNLLSEQDLLSKYSKLVWNDFCLAEKEFIIPSGAELLVISTEENHLGRSYLAIDELLLRPTDAVVFYKSNSSVKESTLFLNNRPQ